MANYSIELIDSTGNYTVTVIKASTTKASGGTNETIPHLENHNASPQVVISAATNATPIVCTSNAHGFSAGDVVTIRGALGNTGANGTRRLSAADTNTFTLENSVGNGTYTANSAVATKLLPTKSLHAALQVAMRAVLNAKASE